MGATYTTRNGLAGVAIATLLALSSWVLPASAAGVENGWGLTVAENSPAAKPRSTRQDRIKACERKVFSDYNHCADVCEAAFPADEPSSRELCTRACEDEAARNYRKCDRIL